jgi:uncharacterized SAM-binding protein YcdF (DUF218 family)
MDMTPLFFGLYKLVKYAIYPLSWVIGCCVLALVLAWLPFSPTRQRWLRVSLTAGVVLLFVLGAPITSYTVMTVLEGWYPQAPVLGRHFDAIVVLGAGINDAGTLRPTVELAGESRHRTLCGAELYLQGAAPQMITTGGGTRIFGGPGVKVAQAMKDWAIRLGVPAHAILTDDDARTTYENAVGVKRVIGPSKSILLVTSAYHIPRSMALFEKQGFEAVPYPCGFHAKDRLMDDWDDITFFDFLPSTGGFQRMTEAVVETAGIVIYWLTGYA